MTLALSGGEIKRAPNSASASERRKRTNVDVLNDEVLKGNGGTKEFPY